MRYYCTYFDINYLAHGLTLYKSLRAVSATGFHLWVLCFDEETFEALRAMDLPGLQPVSLREFEGGDEALLHAKSNRSRIEYYFTCTPSWPLWLLRRYPDVDLVTYLDADIMFHSNPEPVFEELGDRSVLIVGHRFPERLRSLEIHGIYNVGLVSFRNDSPGRECLDWWRARCLEWCYDRVEPGRFADQKYLDNWPELFTGVVVLDNPGAGVAPWNWQNYRIETDCGRILIDGTPLIFYHYHGFKVLNRWLFDTGVAKYGAMSAAVRAILYRPYIVEIKESYNMVKAIVPQSPARHSDARFGTRRWTKILKRMRSGDVILSCR